MTDSVIFRMDPDSLGFIYRVSMLPGYPAFHNEVINKNKKEIKTNIPF